MKSMKSSRVVEVLGEKIKRHRKARDLTQSDLAGALGLTRTSIANIEAGKQHTGIDTLYHIAQLLGVDVGDLLPSLSEAPKRERIDPPADYAVPKCDDCEILLSHCTEVWAHELRAIKPEGVVGKNRGQVDVMESSEFLICRKCKRPYALKLDEKGRVTKADE